MHRFVNNFNPEIKIDPHLHIINSLCDENILIFVQYSLRLHILRRILSEGTSLNIMRNKVNIQG